MDSTGPEQPTHQPSPSPTQDRVKWGVYVKATILVTMIILLFVPTLVIDSLIRERQNRRTEAIAEISSTWGKGQTVTGPILAIPYKVISTDSLGRSTTLRQHLYVLPEVLNSTADIAPEMRYRSIYEVAVYSSRISLQGTFDLRGVSDLGVPLNDILWDEATVSIGVSDLRGISDRVLMNWNGSERSFNSGLPTNDLLAQGITTAVQVSRVDTGATTYSFAMDLQLRGSEYIRFTPVGKVTESQAHSSWSSPSFDGAFLPTKRTVSASGFDANWKVLHLNRSYPQMWLNAAHSLDGSDYGLSLLVPVDQYQKADRSIKYALLFIGLTFLMFFFLELINGKFVHPFQYLLIGLALCLFYTLLISISEHLDYNVAYLIASCMTIGLITAYSASVLRERHLAIMIGSTLVLLYGFIFCIIQLEDYALLIGSLGLFCILAVTMYYSRKIDWVKISSKGS